MHVPIVQKTMVALTLIAAIFLSACKQENTEELDEEVVQPIADTVLINGGIYTVDEERSWVEAAAVIDGSIVAVGSNVDIEEMIGPATNVIDLTGSMALPGFHDAHVHPTM